MSRDAMTDTPAISTQGDTEVPFLARWSRRKLGQDTTPEPQVATAATVGAVGAVASVDAHADSSLPIAPAIPEVVEPAERIDPRTGKPMSELTDEDMPDLESLNADSDVSAFLGGKVSQALRTKALTKVFHTSKFNQVCICAEYAEDYTNFTPLGDIVPHDLKRAILREAGKLIDRLTELGHEITPEEAEAQIAAEFRGERPAMVLPPRADDTPVTEPEPSDDGQVSELVSHDRSALPPRSPIHSEMP